MDERRASIEFWKHSAGRRVELVWIDGSKSAGILQSLNGDESLLNISQLETPLGIYPEAQVLASDVKYLRFKKDLDSLNE